MIGRLAYLALIVPIGALSRLLADPLGLRQPPRQSNWRSLDAPDVSLDRARSQA